MCEASAYYHEKDGSETLLMESVDTIVPAQDGYVLENIFSERKTIRAKIKEMALVHHRIVFEAND